jgi:aryl-alcohol dehydrogenase-like predicted oxidoreductase
MESYRFGTTSVHVTPIGLGLAALGRPGYINLDHAVDLNQNYSIDAMQEHANSVLDQAYQLGVRYFDAARSYGLAERFLGSWLDSRGILPQNVTVGSKWGYTYTADWQVEAEKHEVKEHTREVLRRQWVESLNELDEYLDLYQIHSATFESGVLENQEVLDELSKIKHNGTLIGLTVSGPQQAEVIERALKIKLDGLLLFDSIQATWNLLEKSSGMALENAHQAGLGVIIKEALANGRLTERNHDPKFAGNIEILQNHAKRLNTTIDALALASVLEQPWVDVVLSGAATIEHIRSNVKALELTLDVEAESELRKLTEPPDLYWEKRGKLSWN